MGKKLYRKKNNIIESGLDYFMHFYLIDWPTRRTGNERK